MVTQHDDTVADCASFIDQATDRLKLSVHGSLVAPGDLSDFEGSVSQFRGDAPIGTVWLDLT